MDIYWIYSWLVASRQLCIAYTYFSHIRNLSTWKTCCQIANKKSMDLAQHFNASINSVSFQTGKENQQNWPRVKVFFFWTVYSTKIFHLGYRQIEYNFYSLLFHSFFIFAFNSLQINYKLYLVKYLKSPVWDVVIIQLC